MKKISYVGRVAPIKALDNLCKAYAGADLRQNWKLVIVGPDQEGHTAELKRLADDLGIASYVEFSGPKYGRDLDEVYENADLFVLPSHSENFGSVVIEALAHRVPVVTTKGTPWSELNDFKCGWWIDVGVAPLIKALTEATGLSDEERRAMGARGRTLVEEKYTWDAVCDTMVDGYKEILNG